MKQKTKFKETKIGKIPEDWEIEEIENIYDISSGLSKPREEFGKGYPFLSFMEVFNNFVLPNKLNLLVNSTEKERESCSIKRGDVFLTRTSETQEDLGMSSVALKDYENATFNGFSKRLRPKTNNPLLPEFSAYLFRSRKIRNQIKSFSSLTTRASLNAEMIKKIRLIIPIATEQRAIAKILSDLDTKIELNNKMNKILEAIGQALFKKWFVDNPERENWKKGRLGEFGEIICGKTPSKSIKEFFGGEVPFIKIPDMHNKLFILDTEDSLTIIGKGSQENKTIPKNSLCVSCIATVGLVSITNKESQTNQQINSIVPKKDYFLPYLYYLLKSKEKELKGMGSGGSATLNINTNQFSNLDVILPDEMTLKRFYSFVKDIFNQILTNSVQNQKLSKIRDALLPKLMNGEIRVR